MNQEVKFYLTLIFEKDEKSGDVVAYYAQFPEANAQGRSEDEAQSLLNEIFPYLLSTKADEFLQYHNAAHLTSKEIAATVAA